ncbi:MAG: dihydroorotate dehydrogenase electron transfer subunit [Oscillospiraceae bacterium]
MNVKLLKCKILSNAQLADNIYLMCVALQSNAALPSAGQFYMLRNWGADEAPILSRPISVHDVDTDKRCIYFLYEARGIGTDKLSLADIGSEISLTGALGNGFPLEHISGRVALVGGGIGIAPLLYLAKELKQKGCTIDLYTGFRDAPYALDEFSKFASKISVATDSGKYGTKGFVTELLKPCDYDAVCVCGPDIMMKKIALMCKAQSVPCYVSMEAKMACGVGACLGCTCKTKNGMQHVCKDGPVFDGRDIYAAD